MRRRNHRAQVNIEHGTHGIGITPLSKAAVVLIERCFLTIVEEGII
jgi:hypothetical protein